MPNIKEFRVVISFLIKKNTRMVREKNEKINQKNARQT